jgi:hypothetical protein
MQFSSLRSGALLRHCIPAGHSTLASASFSLYRSSPTARFLLQPNKLERAGHTPPTALPPLPRGSPEQLGRISHAPTVQIAR